jgi:hypothetical protein
LTGTGAGAKATIVVGSNGKISEVIILDYGTAPYQVGDQLVLGPEYAGPGTGFKFTVTIPALTLPLVEGDVFYVNGNSTTIANVKYTVDFMPEEVTPGRTGSVIQVKEIIPPLTDASGTMYVTDDINTIPYWPAGLKVKITSTSTLPSPLVNGGTYYFSPTANIGIFNLAITRYPQEFSDYIDLMSIGSPFKIERAEPFTPGDVVKVYGTQNAANNGNYIISTVDAVGSNFRIGVMQNVPRTTPTPALAPYDGAMGSTRGTYDMPNTCPAIRSPDLYASAYFDEHLQFTFEITATDYVGMTIIENEPAGYGNAYFGEVPGFYSVGMEQLYPYTTIIDSTSVNTGTQLILPTGYDTQLFDMGAIDETLAFATYLQGGSIIDTNAS